MAGKKNVVQEPGFIMKVALFKNLIKNSKIMKMYKLDSIKLLNELNIHPTQERNW